jgi:hypothetical protein
MFVPRVPRFNRLPSDFAVGDAPTCDAPPLRALLSYKLIVDPLIVGQCRIAP